MSRLGVIAFLLSVMLGTAYADNPVDDELKQLEGEWRYVSMEFQGVKIAKGDAKFKPQWRVSISGKSLAWNGRPKIFKIDPSKSPKEMDIVSLDGHESGQTSAAIYKFENDHLIICVPASNANNFLRPNEFKVTAADGRMLVVLERAKQP
jgi:uncharacterized protein (TIGR03067 family)